MRAPVLRTALRACLLVLAFVCQSPAGAAPTGGGLAGSLAGKLLGPGALELPWTLNISGLPARALLELKEDGLAFQLELQAGSQPGEYRWRVLKAEARLEKLQSWLLALSPDLRGVNLSGLLRLEGEGCLRGGATEGWLELHLSGLRLEQPERKLELRGLETRVRLEDLTKLRSAPAQVLTAEGGRLDQLELGALRMQFQLDGKRVLVEQLQLGLMGGAVKLSPFVFDPEIPSLALVAEVEAVELGQVMTLFPGLFSKAQGRLDGYLSLRKNANGVSIEKGYLCQKEGTRSQVRLTPSPGLISGHLPALVLKQYPGFKRLESGECPLETAQLEIVLTPAGDQAGRSASIRLEGGPSDPGLKAPVKLDLNVNGSLESLIKFSSDSRLKF